MTRRTTAVLVALLFLTSTAAFAAGGALPVAYTGLAVAGIGLALWPVLRVHGPGLATAYLLLRCAEGAVLLGIAVTGAHNEPLVYTFTGVGGLVLSVLLLRSGLVPRWLAVLGVVGYAVLLVGVASEALGLTDVDAGFVFFVPGGLFELALPVLLLVKGFTPERVHA